MYQYQNSVFVIQFCTQSCKYIEVYNNQMQTNIKIEMMNNKLQLFNAVLVIVTAIVVVKLIMSWALKTLSRSSKHLRLPPVVSGRLPLIGGLVRFIKNPVEMLKEEHEIVGSVFTLNVLNKNITFLLEPDVSAHFFTAPVSQLSQKEVYRFSVPIFGPGIIYDAEYSVRQEKFRFFEEAFRVTKLRGFVHDLLQEVQVLQHLSLLNTRIIFIFGFWFAFCSAPI